VASAARAAEPTISLGSLETTIDEAPGLEAALRHIDATEKAEGVAGARSGLDYLFDAGFGPRNDIVSNTENNTTVRYAQSAGIQLPLLGTAIAQQNAIGAARTDESLARIAYAEERRDRIAQLRNAYALFWQYGRQREIAEHYAQAFSSELRAARALRRNGFWTEGNLLDFLDALGRFNTDVRTLRTSQRTQLTAISAALGRDVGPFRAIEPVLGAACVPKRADAFRSAAEIDPTLAKIAAETDRLTSQVQRVRGSSIDASAQVATGTVFDLLPPRVGYSLTVGLNVGLPTHARSEERALRDELAAQVDEQNLLGVQRRAEISAAIDGELDELANARDDLAQATRNEASKREDLREAVVRFHTLSQSGAGSFNDVQTTLAELFDAENATAIARGTVYLKASALFLLAPNACDG